MQIETIKIDSNISDNVISWMLDNSNSNTSATKGKTPRDLKYTKDDYQKIEISFDEIYGSDVVTVFFQRKSDGIGKSFKIVQIDDSLYTLLINFYFYRRESRKSIHSIDDILKPKEIKMDVLKDTEFECSNCSDVGCERCD